MTLRRATLSFSCHTVCANEPTAFSLATACHSSKVFRELTGYIDITYHIDFRILAEVGSGFAATIGPFAAQGLVSFENTVYGTEHTPRL